MCSYVGLGVPHQLNSPSKSSGFSPVGSMPLSLLPDHQMLHQLIPQHHHMWMNQSPGGTNYESNSILSYPHSAAEGQQHNITNNSADHLMTNQFQQGSSSPHLNKFCLPIPPPLTMQQIATGSTLVQSPSSNLQPPPADGTGVLPPTINSSSPPRLHRLAPAGGNQGPSYPHQTGLVTSRNVTQRTQQVS